LRTARPLYAAAFQRAIELGDQARALNAHPELQEAFAWVNRARAQLEGKFDFMAQFLRLTVPMQRYFDKGGDPKKSWERHLTKLLALGRDRDR
jgi:hypothetical protein